MSLLIEQAREPACAVILLSDDPTLMEKVCDRQLALAG